MWKRMPVTFSALMNGAHITENKKVLEFKEWLNRNLATDVCTKLGCVEKMVVDHRQDAPPFIVFILR